MAKTRVGVRPRISPNSTLWNDLLAYYTADNTPNDALGNYNGTLTNGATYGTGIINQGFSFDGVNDKVSISPLITTNIKGNAHTYSAWINANVLSGYKWIMQCSGNSKGSSICLNGTKLTYFYQGLTKLVSSTTTLSTSTWYHVAITYDGLNTVTFYINGSSDGTGDVSSWTESGAVTHTNIGSYAISGGPFDGIIDEVATWSRELTPSEVTQLYNSGSGKQYPN